MPPISFLFQKAPRGQHNDPSDQELNNYNLICNIIKAEGTDSQLELFEKNCEMLNETLKLGFDTEALEDNEIDKDAYADREGERQERIRQRLRDRKREEEKRQQREAQLKAQLELEKKNKEQALLQAQTGKQKKTEDQPTR